MESLNILITVLLLRGEVIEILLTLGLGSVHEILISHSLIILLRLLRESISVATEQHLIVRKKWVNLITLTTIKSRHLHLWRILQFLTSLIKIFSLGGNFKFYIIIPIARSAPCICNLMLHFRRRTFSAALIILLRSWIVKDSIIPFLVKCTVGFVLDQLIDEISEVQFFKETLGINNFLMIRTLLIMTSRGIPNVIYIF